MAFNPAASEANDVSTKLNVRRASEIKQRNIQWLWKGAGIPLGKMTLIAGSPKIAKSQIATDMVARVSAGKPWPDGEVAESGRALILSAEDDAEDTIVPRLNAAGANLELIDIVDGLTTGAGKEAGFDFDTGYDALKAYCDEHPDLRLVIIDPVLAYMGKKDSHKAAEVRNALRAYTKLAAERGFALVCITHLNRGKSNDVYERVMASGAFSQVARMNFLVIEDAEEEGRRLFIPFGGNLEKMGDAFAYTVESFAVTIENAGAGEGSTIATSRVKWFTYRVPITADAALRASSDAKAFGVTKKGTAKDLIIEALQERRVMLSDDLAATVLKRGVSFATYKNARDELTNEQVIKARKDKGAGGPWRTGLLRK